VFNYNFKCIFYKTVIYNILLKKLNTLYLIRYVPIYTSIFLKCTFIYLGYIISRVKANDKVCQDCLLNVCVKEPLKTEYSIFLNLKEYKQGCLNHASENTFEFFLLMENIFRENRSLVLNNRKNFMDILNAAIEKCKFPECHNIRSKLLSRFIEFRCKNLACYLNK